MVRKQSARREPGPTGRGDMIGKLVSRYKILGKLGTVYGIHETEDGQSSIAMACYDVQSLKENIGRGPQPISEATYATIQIAQGLAKTHSRGIIHRDIMPANVLWTGRPTTAIQIDKALQEVDEKGIVRRDIREREETQ